MADSHMTTLTDDEREELEALRAEKARREEEERARSERESDSFPGPGTPLARHKN